MKTFLSIIFLAVFASFAPAQSTNCMDGQTDNCRFSTPLGQSQHPCMPSNMNACHSCKKIGGCTMNSPQQLPDTCCRFGDRPSRSGMMRVMGPAYCLDSMNFMVNSERTMPYNCMMGDTVWMNVCLRAHDGQMHHTTVCYGTDQGTKTFDVEIQAPLVSDVQAGTSVPFSISLFPNPSNDRVTVLLSEIPAQAVNVELVDAKGVMVANYMIIGIQELTINTAKLSPGSYQIVLRSKGEAVAAENIVIVR